MPAWAFIGLVVAAFIVAKLLEGRRWKKAPASFLDAVLLYWTKNDPFTVRDLLSGGIAIMGRTGSGKTSSSGKEIGRAIVKYRKSGGLINAAKSSDVPMWRQIFREAGREDDLLIFGPDEPLRFNVLNYALSLGGHTRDVTRALTVIGEILKASSTNGGENAQFWEVQETRLIHNAVEVLKIAGEEVSAPNIQRFILT